MLQSHDWVLVLRLQQPLHVKSGGHGTNIIRATNSQDNTIFNVYESSSGDGYHGLLYLFDNAGNNDVKLSTNGDSWLKGGNVGIGTSSPNSRLDIVGGDYGSNNGTVHIKQNVPTNSPTLFIEQTGNGGNNGDTQGLLIKVAGHNGGNGKIIRAIGTYPSTIEAFNVSNSGKVGIGTDNPAADYGSDTILEIKGGTSPGLVINDTGQGSKYGVHADSNDLKITYGSGTLATFQNDGNVGIGVTDPTQILEVGKSTGATLSLRRTDTAIVAGDLIGAINFVGDDPSVTKGGAVIQAKATATWAANNYDTDLIFYTDDSAGNMTERMVINSSGNVGVGTKDNASLYDMHATGRTFQVNGPIMSGRSEGNSVGGPRNTRDWFVYAGPSVNTGAYVHMKTDLWGGGSPGANTEYTMSCFTYHSYYAYGGSEGHGSIGWHNWSGTFSNVQKVNNGSLALVQSSYVSADGYVVLVAKLGAGYAQFSIDWHQWSGYPLRIRKVTAVSQGSAATGVY